VVVVLVERFCPLCVVFLPIAPFTLKITPQGTILSSLRTTVLD